MEKLIVVKSEFIQKEKYEAIKKHMNKKDDWFTPEEIKQFTNIYRKN